MIKTRLHPRWVLALLCAVLFFYGFYLGGVQLVISEVSREYGQNAAGMGGLVAAQHVAAVVLPVVLGALADRIGKKPVLCIGGVALIYMGGETHISALGLVLLLMTVGCDAAYYTLSHKAAAKFTAFEVTYVMFTVGMVFFIPAALIQGTGHIAETFLPAIQSGSFWGAVIYLGLVSSVVAYFLLNFANAHLTVSEASLFSNVTTVVSVLAGVVLLKEPFGLWQIIGVVVICVCVYAANLTPKKRRNDP